MLPYEIERAACVCKSRAAYGSFRLFDLIFSKFQMQG
ncbi:unnamed protein product [Brassica rapa subsp. trilocularis]|uniref:(rape) hypothetical protein n=1 Tax=Brassica napus TaxID=3708 RepID=A0A816NSS7_BRANA|nr:unnamed protein product [Brassica napus]